MNYLSVPIGWLQFWLFTALGILFFASLIRAFMKKAPESGGKRDSKSRIGIILQSIAFFFTGFGRTQPALPLWSAASIAGALAVLLLMSGCLYLFAASSRALGRNWSIEARMRTDHQLIRTGPYARVRHPIYLGMLLFLLGLAVALGHWLQLVVALPLFLVGTVIRTRLEDRLLDAQFGQEFRDYAQSTPALIPRL
ncbi:MAG TPA: isoprenylcysteine carboxylmethyltransferase family protein [Sphingomicrobium sp.]